MAVVELNDVLASKTITENLVRYLGSTKVSDLETTWVRLATPAEDDTTAAMVARERPKGRYRRRRMALCCLKGYPVHTHTSSSYRGGKVCIDAVTVSYTHLDVYKRQILNL